jgi:hypothetical protein
LSGTSQIIFAGRGSQTITSAGIAFTQSIVIATFSGSVTLQDALNITSTASNALDLSYGSFNANVYNVTVAGTVFSGYATVRTIAFGSGTWLISNAFTLSAANTTVTGTGTISMNSGSAKTFGGNNANFSGITLDQGGAGTLTISGNNRFKNITNTYSATGATNITISNTIQRVTEWTGTGTSGKVLTVQGTSATIPGTLILTGSTRPNVDYLTITGVRAYSLDTTWYAGTNSTNNGSLGWYFEVAPPASTGNFFLVF